MKQFLLLLSLFAMQNLVFSQGYDHDLSVGALLSPEKTIGVSSNIIVTVEVINSGNSAESGIALSCSMDGGSAVIEYCSGPLVPGQHFNYSFISVVDFSQSGCHSLEISVEGTGDQYFLNNFKTFEIFVTNLSNITTDTLYPLNTQYGSGSTTGQIYSQSSDISFSGDSAVVGWVIFDINSFTDLNIALSAELHLKAAYPYTSKKLLLKTAFIYPWNQSAANTYNEIISEDYYIDYNQPVIPGQDVIIELPLKACRMITHMQQNLYYSIGFVENSDDSGDIGTFAGWDQPNVRPYLVIHSQPISNHDPAIVSCNLDTVTSLSGPVIPQVMFSNEGMSGETFTATASASNGYSSTVALPPLPPGTMVYANFAVLTPAAGLQCLTVSLSSATDGNCSNNIFKRCFYQLLPSNISGTVSYANNDSTLITDSSYVELVDISNPGNVLTSFITDQGEYSFSGVPAGTYSLKFTSIKSWGGGNSVDALLVLKHFTGFITLSGISAISADVSGNGIINSLDALMIVKRYMWIITEFLQGDWVSEEPVTTVPQPGTGIVNLKVRCRGDVNGSFIP